MASGFRPSQVSGKAGQAAASNPKPTTPAASPTSAWSRPSAGTQAAQAWANFPPLHGSTAAVAGGESSSLVDLSNPVLESPDFLARVGLLKFSGDIPINPLIESAMKAATEAVGAVTERSPPEYAASRGRFIVNTLKGQVKSKDTTVQAGLALTMLLAFGILPATSEPVANASAGSSPATSGGPVAPARRSGGLTGIKTTAKGLMQLPKDQGNVVSTAFGNLKLCGNASIDAAITSAEKSLPPQGRDLANHLRARGARIRKELERLAEGGSADAKALYNEVVISLYDRTAAPRDRTAMPTVVGKPHVADSGGPTARKGDIAADVRVNQSSVRRLLAEVTHTGDAELDAIIAKAKLRARPRRGRRGNAFGKEIRAALRNAADAHNANAAAFLARITEQAAAMEAARLGRPVGGQPSTSATAAPAASATAGALTGRSEAGGDDDSDDDFDEEEEEEEGEEEEGEEEEDDEEDEEYDDDVEWDEIAGEEVAPAPEAETAGAAAPSAAASWHALMDPAAMHLVPQQQQQQYQLQTPLHISMGGLLGGPPAQHSPPTPLPFPSLGSFVPTSAMGSFVPLSAMGGFMPAAAMMHAASSGPATPHSQFYTQQHAASVSASPPPATAASPQGSAGAPQAAGEGAASAATGDVTAELLEQLREAASREAEAVAHVASLQQELTVLRQAKTSAVLSGAGAPQRVAGLADELVRTVNAFLEASLPAGACGNDDEIMAFEGLGDEVAHLLAQRSFRPDALVKENPHLAPAAEIPRRVIAAWLLGLLRACVAAGSHAYWCRVSGATAALAGANTAAQSAVSLGGRGLNPNNYFDSIFGSTAPLPAQWQDAAEGLAGMRAVAGSHEFAIAVRGVLANTLETPSFEENLPAFAERAHALLDELAALAVARLLDAADPTTAPNGPLFPNGPTPSSGLWASPAFTEPLAGVIRGALQLGFRAALEHKERLVVTVVSPCLPGLAVDGSLADPDTAAALCANVALTSPDRMPTVCVYSDLGVGVARWPDVISTAAEAMRLVIPSQIPGGNAPHFTRARFGASVGLLLNPFGPAQALPQAVVNAPVPGASPGAPGTPGALSSPAPSGSGSKAVSWVSPDASHRPPRRGATPHTLLAVGLRVAQLPGPDDASGAGPRGTSAQAAPVLDGSEATVRTALLSLSALN